MNKYTITRGYATAPGEDIAEEVVIVTDTRCDFATPYSKFILFDCDFNNLKTDDDIDDYPDDYACMYEYVDENGIYHC